MCKKRTPRNIPFVPTTDIILHKILLFNVCECRWCVTRIRTYCTRKSICLLSQLVPIIHQQLSEIHLQIIKLLVRQRTFHQTVLDTKAAAVSLGFGVCESVDARDLFRQITSHVTNPCTKVIFMESIGLPKGNVLVTHWIFGKLFKRHDFALFELVVEPGVLAPEQSDIWNGKWRHSKALKADPKRPSTATLESSVFDHAWLNRTASQHF